MFESIMRDVARSLCVDWRTTSPYAMGKVACCRVGFADIPVVEVVIYHRCGDNLTTIARQAAYREVEAAGICCDCIAYTPSVALTSRKTKVTDTNTASPTLGTSKMLCKAVYRFEIVDRDAVPAIRNCLARSWDGSAL